LNFTDREILFSILFKPLINFQEINIYWKNFHFNYFFYFLLSHSFIFQEIKPYSMENEKTISHLFFDLDRNCHSGPVLHSFSLGLNPSLLAQKSANASSAQLTARAQAAPRPQPGPGPAKHRAPRARLGRSVGPIICSRSI